MLKRNIYTSNLEKISKIYIMKKVSIHITPFPWKNTILSSHLNHKRGIIIKTVFPHFIISWIHLKIPLLCKSFKVGRVDPVYFCLASIPCINNNNDCQCILNKYYVKKIILSTSKYDVYIYYLVLKHCNIHTAVISIVQGRKMR